MAGLLFRVDVIEDGDAWMILGECPQGRRRARIPVPFADGELQSSLRSVERALDRSTSPLITRRANRPELEFGRKLSRILLADDVRIIFDRCRQKAHEQRTTMRILLNPVGPNVCKVPWEFAVDPDADDEYLALRLPLARSPNLMEPVEPLRTEPPLRILIVLSRPRDLPKLEADLERTYISDALRGLSSDLVEIKWMESDRWQDLRTTLQSEPFHVLHFIGHGGFDEETQSGYIELTDETGNALRVQAGDLAGFVRNNPQMKLVVLNACESATAGEDGVFSSTAARLMRAGIPAVVAMQYEITDPAALAFSVSFYEAIAHGLSLDHAVTQARQDLKILTGSLEWATPVLFLASEETHIFALPEQLAPHSHTQPGGPSAPPNGVSPTDGHPATDYSPRERPAGILPTATEWSGQVRARLDHFMSRLTADPQAPVRSGEGPRVIPSIASRQSTGPRTTPLNVDLTSRSEGTGSPTRTSGPEPSGADGDQAAGPQMRNLWASPQLGSCTHFELGPQSLAALAMPDGVRVMSLLSRAEVARCVLPSGDRPLRVAWSPWPRHLASLHEGGTVVVWELGSETPVQVLSSRQARGTQITFSHDGRWLAMATEDRNLRIFGAKGEEVRSLTVNPLAIGASDWQSPLNNLTQLTFTPDDRGLLVGADDGAIRQFDAQGRLIRTWRHTHAVTALAASVGRVASGTQGGSVRTWTWDGNVIHRLNGVMAEQAMFSPDGDTLVAIGKTGCHAWNRSGSLCGWSRPAARPVGIGISRNGDLITVTQNGIIEGWALPAAHTEPREATDE